MTDPRAAGRLLALAVGFLTRLPVPQVAVRDGDLARASWAFPLVGVLVAAVGVAVRAAAGAVWTPTVGTVAAVAAMVAVTGAFHEDGLADTADGLWGGETAERRLAIMRDSRLGTYGTVALVAALALRVALLAPLDVAGFARAVLAGAVLGRASTLVLVRLLPPVGPSSAALVVGCGEARPGRTGRASTAGVLLAASTVVAALAPLGWWAPVALLAGALVILAAARLFARRIGGVTGDTLGAANQAVDLAAVAAGSALIP